MPAALRDGVVCSAAQPDRRAVPARKGDSMDNDLTRLREMRERAILGGGPQRIEEQHKRGKMTARERLAHLLDENSFQEIGALAAHNCSDFGMERQRYPGDGVV